MQTFALKLEYDGAAFGGSQYQANARSVQGALEAALASLGLCGRVALAGRTDAGVHAEGQVAAATLVRPWAASDLQCAINARLPEDAAVVAAAVAPEGFDPRRWAVSRRYRYRMLIGSVRSPLRRRHAWHVRYEVDEEAMRTAASALVGEHDFAAFGGRLGSAGGSTRRRMFDVALRRDGRLLELEFEATAFLPHQVRRTVGALVEVGRGRLTVEEFQ
ncbi:MAG TPA: tRNA pseudouridine(38-40) synthase TruA, partial [Dehalococcoidia bacterium]|nr:tRNA pseudouridine(38-40) synthase TruA [Dehalococcoidia bacterium]